MEYERSHSSALVSEVLTLPVSIANKGIANPGGERKIAGTVRKVRRGRRVRELECCTAFIDSARGGP